MSSRKGKQTFVFDKRPAITSYASIAGKKEGEGPFGRLFDVTLEDDTWGEKSWERSESKLQRECVRLVIDKSTVYLQEICLISVLVRITD